MRFIEGLHSTLISPRRARALREKLAELIPPGARVLDVGAGDGRIARSLVERRQDIELHALDVHPRHKRHFPVGWFDGRVLPFPARSFDVVLLVDVLHHCSDRICLLRETARVARFRIIVKDHAREGWFAASTLRLMDYVGNRGMRVPAARDYWTIEQWMGAFATLGFSVTLLARQLDIYPWPVSWVFGRSLHVLASQERPCNPNLQSFPSRPGCDLRNNAVGLRRKGQL